MTKVEERGEDSWYHFRPLHAHEHTHAHTQTNIHTYSYTPHTCAQENERCQAETQATAVLHHRPSRVKLDLPILSQPHAARASKKANAWQIFEALGPC